MNRLLNKKITQISASVLISFTIGCGNEDDKTQTAETETGTLNLSIDNVVGNEDLVLNTKTYTNTSNEDYTVTDFKYILSNIRLIGEDNSEFAIPKKESYFLTTEAKPESLSIDLTKIPVGNYKTIKFGFGIDQSNYPIETGTLSLIEEAEAENMLWNWAAGYQFVKLEGEFSSSSKNEPYKLHIGSLGDKQDNYKEVTLELINNVEVGTSNNAIVDIIVDVSKIFDAKNTISLDATPSVQVDMINSPLVAENAQLMFRLK